MSENTVFGMTRLDFLNATIDDGITEIQQCYLRPDQSSKRSGGIAGLEACRGKYDAELLQLLNHRRNETQKLLLNRENPSDYWYARMYELQVEWVLNVLSAALYSNGIEPVITPTLRGWNKACDILSIRATA